MEREFIPDKTKAEYEYAISACLCGVCCRYDGRNNTVEEIKRIYDSGNAILICPEVMGGMPTPRLPCEISDGRVVNSAGEDMTEQFTKGAQLSLELCKRYSVKKCILKQSSPSCGTRLIYDGTFSSVKIEGMGITAKLLKENGIVVTGEK